MTEHVPPIAANGHRRRSTRIEHAVPLVIVGRDASGKILIEVTATLSINCHGCRYFSRFRVRRHEAITVQVGATVWSSASAERSLPARVAWIQKSYRLAGRYQVGIEFESPRDLWRIGDAPEDWNRFNTAEKEGPDQLLNEVERLLHFARTSSYSQLLGLRPDSPRAEVKHRFHQLARQFHPDRHMNHPAWTPRLLLLMESLTMAYKTLSNEAAKKGHVSQRGDLEHGQEGTAAQLLAQECLENAQKCLGAKNYVGAIPWLRRAIEAKPQSSEYHTMLGLSLTAIPEYRHEAVEQFEVAIRLDPSHLAAHFHYARLHEQMKFPLRARLHYARVLELDPSHLQARERLYELDARSPRSISRPSLLTRLTGRR